MTYVGKTIPHDSARGHVTGKADYLDDLPRYENELLVGVVGSPVAAGTICSVDLEAAKKVPGVVAILTHEDIPGHKLFGPLFQDEPFLAIDQVLYIGQPVVLIAATDRNALRKAEALVKITVDAIKPILSIDDAIKASSFIGVERRSCKATRRKRLPHASIS